MLTRYHYPIDYELDISPMNPIVVLESFIYKQTSLLKDFLFKFLFFLISFIYLYILA